MTGDGPARRILAFEPFDAGSHRAVRESLSRCSRHEWTWLTRPGRAWKWRMRLAAVEMIEDARSRGLLDEDWDAIFATSLMSVADLRGALPGRLRDRPIVLYMHENQAAYPHGHRTSDDGERDFQFPLTNLTSIVAATAVLWNSNWNRDSFLEGVGEVLRHAIDLRGVDTQAMVEAKSRVVWPPVEPPPAGIWSAARHDAAGRSVRVAWPHRWEHDKGPEELLDIAERCTETLDLRWTILGERYRRVPEPLREFEHRFASRIDHFGYEPDRSSYWRHLGRCDWVLSTARHEFFGIAVVEAMLAGCLPWLPGRLSYPELTPAIAHNLSPQKPPADSAKLRAAIHAHLEPALEANAVARFDEVIDCVC